MRKIIKREIERERENQDQEHGCDNDNGNHDNNTAGTSTRRSISKGLESTGIHHMQAEESMARELQQETTQ